MAPKPRPPTADTIFTTKLRSYQKFLFRISALLLTAQNLKWNIYDQISKVPTAKILQDKNNSQGQIDEKNMEELEDKKPNIKLENSAEWLDDPANKIWTLGKFL